MAYRRRGYSRGRTRYGRNRYGRRSYGFTRRRRSSGRGRRRSYIAGYRY